MALGRGTLQDVAREVRRAIRKFGTAGRWESDILVRCMSEGVEAWSAWNGLSTKRRRPQPNQTQHAEREEALVVCLCNVYESIPATSVMCKRSTWVLLACALTFPDRAWNSALAWQRQVPLDPELTPSLVFGDGRCEDEDWIRVMWFVERVLKELIRRAQESQPAWQQHAGTPVYV